MKWCTIVDRRSLPWARVLAQSLRVVGAGPLSVLVTDQKLEGDVAPEPFELIETNELKLSRWHFHALAMVNSSAQLAEVLKPWLGAHLLDRDPSPVCIVDPHIAVLSSLDNDLLSAAQTFGIASSGEVRRVGTETTLFDADLNPTMVVVDAKAGDILQTWREDVLSTIGSVIPDRASRSAWADNRALSGFVVRADEVDGRKFTLRGSQLFDHGSAIRALDLRAFSPLHPYAASVPEDGDQIMTLDEHPALARFCLRYANRLLKEGFLESQSLPSGFTYRPGGEPIDQRMRDIYRTALESTHRVPDDSHLPDPYEPEDSLSFERWMFSGDEDPLHQGVSRYFRRIYDERPDLRAHFPDLNGVDQIEFLKWSALHPRIEQTVPLAYVPPYHPPIESLVSSEALPEGVNVVGYLDAEDGVGGKARQYDQVLEAAHIDRSLIPYEFTPSRRGVGIETPLGSTLFDTDLICINADQIPLAALQLGHSYPRANHRIAVWAWEVDHFPTWMAESQYFADEIWTYSEHAARAMRPVMSIPVFVVPPPIPVVEQSDISRADLSLPSGFVFLFCFSYFSVFERKNPLAVIRAFKRAFAPDSGAQLVIKSVHGWHFEVDRWRLMAEADGRDDIRIIDAYETPERQRALIENCDAYVSLHRAEGFGLTLAEAMSYAKPVIATNYSGNLEFMTEKNSYLVPFELAEIPLGCDPYPIQGAWAEPDIDAAAAQMRLVFDDQAKARATGSRALSDILTLHSPEARVDLVRSRIGAWRGDT